MRRCGLILPVLLVALALPAAAQTEASNASVETVIVNGTKINPDKVVHDFIKSYAAPTTFLDKMARWQDPICPRVAGLTPDADAFITQRIKDVAAKVGAKVETKPCQANVEVIFTADPQAFLDHVRAISPELLGWHTYDDSIADKMRLASFSPPVEAWYATDIKDYLGNKRPELSPSACASLYPPPFTRNHCPPVPVRNNRLFGDGQESEFSHALVVVDADKLGNYAISPLADFMAMLALSQTKAFGACQDLPTIANLMSPGCDANLKANALTDTDFAYLSALYKMDAGDSLSGQRDAIADRMEKALTGH